MEGTGRNTAPGSDTLHVGGSFRSCNDVPEMTHFLKPEIRHLGWAFLGGAAVLRDSFRA